MHMRPVNIEALTSYRLKPSGFLRPDANLALAGGCSR
jgi:hypothetical protein